MNHAPPNNEAAPGVPHTPANPQCGALVLASGSAFTPAQRKLIELMRAGRTLMWFGSAGPELSGRLFWPQKRTVRALIARGMLKWGAYNNETQRQAGFIPVLLNDAVTNSRADKTL